LTSGPGVLPDLLRLLSALTSERSRQRGGISLQEDSPHEIGEALAQFVNRSSALQYSRRETERFALVEACWVTTAVHLFNRCIRRPPMAQALETTDKLSAELRAAEGRIRELKAKVRHHQDRADRAEKWLHQVSVEIEQKFFPSGSWSSLQPPPQQTLSRNQPR
jgi:hypothetical protein